MPQQPAQTGANGQSFELQQARWNTIGIHAVAAASLYTARKAKRPARTAAAPHFMSHLELATD